MSDFDDIAGQPFQEEISSHGLFKELDLCFDLYDSLSDSVFGYVTRTRSYIGNLDSCFFDSFAGTFESIKIVLLAGRFADAYTLLRRYFETTWLHIYVMLRLEQPLNLRSDGEDVSIQNVDQFLELFERMAGQDIYIEEVETWLRGDKKLPTVQVFSPRITSSPAVEHINLLFDAKQYKEISERCNDYVHLNYFRNLLLNNASDRFEDPTPSLDQFARDFRAILIRHIAYVFGINQHYMSSSDYVDALEMGQQPEFGSQYWVMPIVQEVFNAVVTPNRPDVTQFIKENTSMELQ